jgi:murein L,D-transpeptidase YcbB/YkuD
VYATALVDDQGDVRFYPDLYRRDAALERILALPPITARATSVLPR